MNSIGAAVLNPNRSDCIELTIDIPALAGQSTVPVMFPCPEEVEHFAFEMSQGSISSVSFLLSLSFIKNLDCMFMKLGNVWRRRSYAIETAS